MGGPVRTQLQSAFLSRKHTGNHLQQVSPFYHVGFHLLLKFCPVWIGRLGVKIVESFQFEFWPGVMCARFSFASLWKVISDQYFAFSTVNMSSCSSSKFPLEAGFVGSDTIKCLPVITQTAFRVEIFIDLSPRHRDGN